MHHVHFEVEELGAAVESADLVVASAVALAGPGVLAEPPVGPAGLA